jgi:hypothetical protein
MKAEKAFRVLLTAGLAVGWLGAGGSGRAAEEARKFLDGLRGRGYYDTAVDYLEQLRGAADCPEELKEVIDYELGTIHVAGSWSDGSVSARQAELEAAEESFKRFLADHPGHSLSFDANTQLGNVLVQQGANLVEQAQRASKSEADKKSLSAQARQKYEEAKKLFEVAESLVYQRAKNVQNASDSSKTEERDQIYGDLLQARLFLAHVAYEIGKTYPPKSDEFVKHLTAATAQYNALYEKYKAYGAGLRARVWEGRTRADLGENEKAVAIFKEMLTLNDDPRFQALRIQSLTLLLETYLKPEVKKYAEAEALFDSWQKAAADQEKSTADGLKLHLLGGRAALAQAKSLEAKDAGRKDKIAAARRNLEFVARFSGDARREANELLADAIFGDATAAAADPVDFADARDRCDSAWNTMVIADGRRRQAQSAEDRAKFASQAGDASDDVIRYGTMALAMRTDETPIAEVNQIRSYLTYLYWSREDLYRAAVLGEFLAREYSESAAARSGAEIAVKAYRMMFIEALKASQDTTFETRRMTSIAEYVTKRWEGQREADEAWMMLLETAVDNKDLDGAQGYLQKIAADSPQRADAELRVGQALWEAYATAAGDEQTSLSSAARDELVRRAQETLEQGIRRMRDSVDAGGAVGYPLVYSVYSLAQILIDTGRTGEAVTWLEDPKIGPLTLVAARNPVTDYGNFRINAYMAALRAYVGTQQLEKAEEAMNSLEKLVGEGGDADAGKRLTQIYVQLGRELEELLTRLRNEQKLDEMEKVTGAFRVFLDRISQREQGTNYNSLNWVAETFFSLGAGFDPGVGETPAEAVDYYKKAAETYLKIAKLPPDQKPEGADNNIKVRLAASLSAMGRHEDAMKLLVGIIKKHETWVTVQIEAARTYQAWAALQGKSDYYSKAILGGNVEGGRPIVWGWGGIARRVAPLEKYRGTFHEARYNLALCRMKLALASSGEKKTKTLEQAEKDITMVYQLYPKMGGPEWFAKYDSLLKSIRTFRGMSNPKGLK